MLNANETARLAQQPEWVREVVARLVVQANIARADAEKAQAELATMGSTAGTTVSYATPAADGVVNLPDGTVITFCLPNGVEIDVELSDDRVTVTSGGPTLDVRPHSGNVISVGAWRRS